jgi:hypothetical protein
MNSKMVVSSRRLYLRRIPLSKSRDPVALRANTNHFEAMNAQLTSKSSHVEPEPLLKFSKIFVALYYFCLQTKQCYILNKLTSPALSKTRRSY